MIRARLVLDSGGRIARFQAEGHALHAPAGKDIVCAAFTSLARATCDALSALPGAELDIEAGEPGFLGFEVRQLGASSKERAAGIADVLLAGLAALEEDFPSELGIVIQRIWRE